MDLRLNNKFDGNKIKITRIRENNDWYGNAVHFQYNGQTYRASIYDEGSDDDGVEIRYAHLQIADKFGNWGTDIAKKDNEDKILITLKDFAEKARNRMYQSVVVCGFCPLLFVCLCPLLFVCLCPLLFVCLCPLFFVK